MKLILEIALVLSVPTIFIAFLLYITLSNRKINDD